jgi:endothelin-converting enzyme/putative endopeptidase
MDKLGGPVDKGEWLMTPQTLNAYYYPSMNEIVFPAAILQPPFFDVRADDAINYGAIGSIIGHEFSHGFDDQGRKSDGDGNMTNWWTEEDEAEFKRRADGLVEQYNGYQVFDDAAVNGELTLGENIGDLAGLTMAYRAYKLSLNGKEAPIIGGFTGEQRFFLGFASAWRTKRRDDLARRYLTIDSHSPPMIRCNGSVINMPEFAEAFDVKEGDGMWKAPEDRVKIW